MSHCWHQGRFPAETAPVYQNFISPTSHAHTSQPSKRGSAHDVKTSKPRADGDQPFLYGSNDLFPSNFTGQDS